MADVVGASHGGDGGGGDFPNNFNFSGGSCRGTGSGSAGDVNGDNENTGGENTNKRKRIYRDIPGKVRGHWKVRTIDRDGKFGEACFKTIEVEKKAGENLKIVVHFPSGKDPPGDEGQLLNRYIGDVAKDTGFLPVSAYEWRLVERSLKEDYWRTFFEPRFYIAPEEWRRGKKYILRKSGDAWARNRCRLFDHYYSASRSLDDNLRATPEGVSEAQWGAFLKMRTDENKKKKVAQNKKNADKQKSHHAGGSRPYTRYHEELFLQTGKEPSRGEVWKRANLRPNGEWEDDLAAYIAERIDYHEVQGVTRVPSYGDSLDLAMRDADPQYKGEHSGRVRTMGISLTPSQLILGESNSRVSGASVTSAYTSHGQVDYSAAAREERDRRIAELLQELERRDDAREAEMAQEKDRLGAELRKEKERLALEMQKEKQRVEDVIHKERQRVARLEAIVTQLSTTVLKAADEPFPYIDQEASDDEQAQASEKDDD
ncbi:hypothetical protein LINPERPRIM_LOCUS29703 [Linum perenne]